METTSTKPRRKRIGTKKVSSSDKFAYLEVLELTDRSSVATEHPEVDVMYMTRKQFEALKRTCPQRLLKYKNALNNYDGVVLHELSRERLNHFIRVHLDIANVFNNKREKQVYLKRLAETTHAKRSMIEYRKFKKKRYKNRFKEYVRTIRKLGIEKMTLKYQGHILEVV